MRAKPTYFLTFEYTITGASKSTKVPSVNLTLPLPGGEILECGTKIDMRAIVLFVKTSGLRAIDELHHSE